MRRALLAALLAALAAAPAAGAWTKLTGDTLQNIVDPSVVAIQDGTGREVIAYREPVAGNLKVIRNGSTLTLASGLPFVGDPVLVGINDDNLLLYAGEGTGVVLYVTDDGGQSWSPPVPIPGSKTGDVQAAAVAPGGPPPILFSQDGTGFIDVYSDSFPGLSQMNAFPFCCGYAESLAIDSTGRAQIAFWSNATGQSGYLYGPIGGPYVNLTGGKESLANDARVPLVADALGNTFLGWQTGYPEANAFVVNTYRGGALQHSVRFSGIYAQPDPAMALSVDASGRLWALWTRQNSVWAARSRSHGAHFGAAVRVAKPGSVYQLEAAARPDGSVDAVVNTGSNLQEQRLLAGLTVVATKTAARVLDDGVPVAGAAVKGGGKTLKTSGAGTVSLAGVKPHALMAVSAAGYAPTGFRVP
jgi:hypothetical protein